MKFTNKKIDEKSKNKRPHTRQKRKETYTSTKKYPQETKNKYQKTTIKPLNKQANKQKKT